MDEGKKSRGSREEKGRYVRGRWERTFDDSSKYNMFAVQVRTCAQGDEELGSVCVGTSVRHD